MSTTSTTPAVLPDAAPSPAATTRLRAGLVSLVGGAVALALGRAMTINGGSPEQRLQQVAGHQTQLTVSVLLAVAGFAAFIGGFLTVAGCVRRRGALLATIGSGLTLAGCVGFVVLVSVDNTTNAASHVASPGAMADLLHQLDITPAVIAVTPIAVIGYFVGPFLVTLGARRAGFVPRWLPWGVLGSLILQPVGVVLGGPGAAHLLDTAFQLVLVVMVAFLARFTLADQTNPG